MNHTFLAYEGKSILSRGCGAVNILTERGDILVQKWTGRLVGKMHNERIKAEDIASELGVSKAYVSMILNGKRTPPNAKERLEAALDSIVAKKREGA